MWLAAGRMHVRSSVSCAVSVLLASLLLAASWPSHAAAETADDQSSLPSAAFSSSDSTADPFVSQSQQQQAHLLLRRDWWVTGSEADALQCNVEYRSEGHVVGLKSHTTARACAKSCRIAGACTVWLWCQDTKGCMVEDGARLSINTCIMWKMPQLPRSQPLLVEAYSDPAQQLYNCTMGYLSGYLYRRPMGVQMLTAQQGCKGSWKWSPREQAKADHLSSQSLVNKINFASLHGMPLQIVVNPTVSKMALIAEALEQQLNSRAPETWLLWMGAAGMVARPDFAFPLRDYISQGKDLVVRGHPDGVMNGDAWDFDTQIMLIHNTLWTRSFFQQAASLMGRPSALQESIDLLAGFHPMYNVATVTDRLVMAHLMRLSPSIRERVHFEMNYCLACGMGNLDLRAPTSFLVSLHGMRQCNEHCLAPDDKHEEHMERIVNASNCGYMKALQQAAPFINAPSHVAMGLPYVSRMQRNVVSAGRHNRQPSLEACRTSCLEHSACTAWLYCWHPGGCDDSIHRNPVRYPRGACELLQLPHDVSIAPHPRPMAFSSSSTGFNNPGHRRLLKAHAAVMPADATSRRLNAANEEIPEPQSVAIVTAIPPSPCAFPIADTINVLSVANKQDYAHHMGYEVHLSAHNIDPTVKGNFNKLKAMQKLLNDTPPASAAWLWWLDIDTVITDPTQRLPLSKYDGYDMVIWGDADLVAAGDIQGLNTGSILLRNSEWSRALLAELCAHAHREDLESVREEIEESVHMVPGFLDTPLLVWMLKKTPGALDRVFFEREIGINRHWLQVEWDKGEKPLMVHYAGCTFCHPPQQKLGDAIIASCTSEVAKALTLAECTLGKTHLGANVSDCRYDATDLSWINIRLGV